MQHLLANSLIDIPWMSAEKSLLIWTIIIRWLVYAKCTRPKWTFLHISTLNRSFGLCRFVYCFPAIVYRQVSVLLFVAFANLNRMPGGTFAICVLF